MAQDTSRPSMFRIVQSDYLTGLSILVVVVFWGMYVAIAYFGFFPGLRGRSPLTGSDAPFFLDLSIIATLIAVPLIIWRIHSFHSIFVRGVEVTGRITSISFFRDRGRVEYTYVYQGKSYESGNAIHKTGRTKTLQPDSEITLVVDRENPKRALIRDLYV